MERLERLNLNFGKELAIDIVLNSFPSSYDQFILTYYFYNTETRVIGLHSLFQTVEARMKNSHLNSTENSPVIAFHRGKGKKRKDNSQPKWIGKAHIGESSGG